MGTQQLSPHDLEQLSAYLDGELSTKDATRLEQRLWNDPTLRDALDRLDRTRLMLRSLPPVRAPRNFTLSREYARQRATPRLYPLFGFASAVALTLLLAVLIGDWLGVFFPNQTIAQAQPTPAVFAVPAVLDQATAMIEEAAAQSAAPVEAPAAPTLVNTPTSTNSPEPTSTLNENTPAADVTVLVETATPVEPATTTPQAREFPSIVSETNEITLTIEMAVTDTAAPTTSPTETSSPTPTITPTVTGTPLPTTTITIVPPTDTAVSAVAKVMNTPQPTPTKMPLAASPTAETPGGSRQIGDQPAWRTVEVGLLVFMLLTAAIALVNYRRRLF
jgi:hypothetical protein